MFIRPFVTKRIEAEFKPITLRGAIDLCAVHESMNEHGIGKALSCIVNKTSLPISEWTVQERYAAICHYITAQEQKDWQVSDVSRYSDYQTLKDYPSDDRYEFVMKDGKEEQKLVVVPLTGEYAEAVERCVFSNTKGDKQGDWVVGCMAAQIRDANDEWDGSADEFVSTNYEKILDMNEEDFQVLFEHFQLGLIQLTHIFNIAFAPDGLIVLPNEDKEDVGIPPTRFPFTACYGAISAALWKVSD